MRLTSARVPVTAVNMEVRIPMLSVTAKPLIGPVPKAEQHDRRNQRGQVGVEDGAEGQVEAGVNRAACGLLPLNHSSSRIRS